MMALISLLADASAAAESVQDLPVAPQELSSPLGSVALLTTEIGIAVIVLGLLLCVLRLLLGPHIADRALAVDTIAVHLIALVVLFTIRVDTLLYFDGVLTLSLLGFATTVAAAQFIVRRRLRQAGVREDPPINDPGSEEVRP